jgi:hypothetical protein
MEKSEARKSRATVPFNRNFLLKSPSWLMLRKNRYLERCQHVTDHGHVFNIGQHVFLARHTQALGVTCA